MKNQNARPKSSWLIVMVYAIPLGILGCLLILFMMTDTIAYVRWRRNTSPLPFEVQNDLCAKLLLSPDGRLCTSNSVLAPEFFPRIQEVFIPNKATHEEIQAILGDYQWEKEPLAPLGDGRNYYRVSYDLRGDHMYAVFFYFYEEGSLIKLQEYYVGIE